MEVFESIRKFVLKNAFDYGKASEGGVVGKVIAEHPEAKGRMQEVMQEIRKEISRVNSLSKEEIEGELKEFSFEKKEKKEERWNLPGAEEGKVKTRFLPEPNGFLHIGHAKSIVLSSEFARMWKGKCVIGFDDTNPEKESQEYVDSIREDTAWLGFKFAGEYFSSDKMQEFYEQGKVLLEKGKGFVCTCSQEEIKEKRGSMKECACRNRNNLENKELWEKMLSRGFSKGEAIVRFKGDMKSENTMMRDPTMFRIIDARHYRQGGKYCVWPTYDFSASVSDSLEGITHALRSKEYELHDELYYAVLDALGLRKPLVYDFSRLNLKGVRLSKRFIKPLIESGEVKGWDDPRLPSLKGFKRRGILPEAIRKFAAQFGLSKVESTPSIEPLLSENRKLLDPVAERRFFVENPVELIVRNAPAGKVNLKKHPQKDSGFREILVNGKFFVSSSDARSLSEGEVFRLKDLCNVKLLKKGNLLEGELAPEGLVEKKIQWVSGAEGEFLDCVLLKPSELFDDNEVFRKESLLEIQGNCEKSCAELAFQTLVQLERVGFAVLDEKETKERKKLVFVLSC
jgi:glutamyl-tRNA synthetase